MVSFSICTWCWLFQMYTQNGSSLSMDIELRLTFYVSAFHPVSVLYSCWDVLSWVTSFWTSVNYLGKQRFTECRVHLNLFAIRFADVSEQYLGPSIVQMIHLFILLVVNGLTVFAIFILLVRSLWSLGANTTTIESWEIERHSTLLRRARHFGGYLEAPGGARIRIRKQEFPYDIGIWANIKAGMGGSANVSCCVLLRCCGMSSRV